VRRASMYAVGTIKTTADKISEGIKQVKNEDMVKKGEETVEQIKGTTDGIKEKVVSTTNNIKEDIKEIKNLVTSINSSPADSAPEAPEFEDLSSPQDDDVMDLFEVADPDEQL
ncbi:MAG: YtxH domain-containing protein, partial [Oscillospiraceae bacterium]|nr:YtxH domain-containing protein [Oscillospiraceae bacterium]